MEQQAIEYAENKDWNKAAELYTALLLKKPSNTDLLLAYLTARSECLAEMAQHEAVVSDCKKILKILSENKDGFNSTMGSCTQTRLIQALFSLERYGDAELIMREWVALNKNVEVASLLEKMHIAMYESQKKTLLETDPKVSQSTFSCAYCNMTFGERSELRLHCQTEGHQIVIMSDEGRDWHWRPPPRGLNAEAYKQCEYWDERQNCRFGAQCVEAHGPDELAEWKERYKYRQMKMERVYEKELFGKSYTEELLEKCMQSCNPIMSDKLDCVDDSCTDSLVTTVHSKSSLKQWTFNLKTNRSLCAVALLHDVHRSCFKISRIRLNATDLEIKNNQEWISGSTEEIVVSGYQATIEFCTDVYGTFRQSVAFDFGHEPVLVKNICVDVIPAEEARKINDIRREIVLTSAERWTCQNSEIVAFTSINLAMENYDANVSILKLYPCPQADTLTLSHSTVNEKQLTANNYRARMHELLYVEEMARNEQTNKYNLTAHLHVVKSYILSSSTLSSSTAKYSNFGELYGFINLGQDLSEDTLSGRLILNNCTNVLITLDKSVGTKPKVYEALIEDKGKKVIYLRLSATTVTELNLTSDSTYNVQVQFQLNRLPYCEWHYAVDRMPNLKLIFPDALLEPYIPWSPQKQWCDNVDSRLNLKQKEAVIAITTPSFVPLPPILIIGPFGTGKTFTLAQAIKQLLKQENSKILICTHSNSAADLYIKDYLDPYLKDGHEEARPLRIYYQRRWVTTVHPVVQQYCIIQESQGVRTFQAPTLEDIERHRVVVVTLSTSMYLSTLGLPQGYFTHILLDEAAQTIECEAIMPLSLANQNTRVVLAGDHMQISPELFSRFAKERNLHVSLLERLYDYYPTSFPCKILLCENYRAHEAIIDFTSELFYDQKLIASGKQPSHEKLYPLTFYTAKGEDVQDVNSTAFYNSSEAYEIVERVCELKRQWPEVWGKFDEHSIGIMTPYADQVFRIRNELRKRRLGSISVERVLNVQGKQFRAVFLSTVRTRRTCLNNNNSESDENDYGFLSNSKLLNTAITRAQSLVAVVGDPVALCTIGRCSKVWERLIQICVQNDSLFGITWSFLKNQLDGLELKKTYGLNPLAPEFVPRQFTKAEAYIKLPPDQQTVVRNDFPQQYQHIVAKQQAQNVFPRPAQPVPMAWSVFRQPNYVWRFPPPTLNNRIAPAAVIIPAPAPPVNLPQPVVTSPAFTPPILPIGRPITSLTQPAQTPSPSSLPPERDLIQFLDNVHIPANVKSNSNSLHDLINLLPEDMSLATVLMQPAHFHKQWFHYLLGRKGIDAAKKFEYLIVMSKQTDKRNINWDTIYVDMLKRTAAPVRDDSFCEMPPYLQERSSNLNWFDKPVNQINFNKPVYLKDPLHVDGLQQHRGSDTNGIICHDGREASARLYERQPSDQRQN